MLVNDQERACIAGFDLLCIMEADGLPASNTPAADGTTRFQAPELIDPDCESSRSMASDVYAFGMLCYHVCSLCIYCITDPHQCLDLHGTYPLPRCETRFQCWWRPYKENIRNDHRILSIRIVVLRTVYGKSCRIAGNANRRTDRVYPRSQNSSGADMKHNTAGGGISYHCDSQDREFLMTVHCWLPS